MSGTLERLAKRWADHTGGSDAEWFEDVARWWLNALADEAEADADSHMDAYYAGTKARHAALWLREQNNQAGGMIPPAANERGTK